MNQEDETLFRARGLLGLFLERWKSDSERPEVRAFDPDQDPVTVKFCQDSINVAKQLSKARTIAKSLRAEIPNLKIAIEALSSFDYLSLKSVAYAALAEIRDLLDKDKEVDSENEERGIKGLELWNSGKTWSEVAIELDRTPESEKAVMQEVKRYAKAHALAIRKGTPGARRKK